MALDERSRAILRPRVAALRYICDDPAAQSIEAWTRIAAAATSLTGVQYAPATDHNLIRDHLDELLKELSA